MVTAPAVNVSFVGRKAGSSFTICSLTSDRIHRQLVLCARRCFRENFIPNMKRALLITFCGCFLAIFIALDAKTEPNDQSGLKDHLVNLEKQSWEAWKNRDGKFFQEFLSDDHVEVGFNGVATKADVVGFVGSLVCTVKSYELDHFELKMLDKNTALLTYREAQDTVCHKAVPSPCWVSSLYMKRGDRWQNVLYQQSQIEK